MITLNSPLLDSLVINPPVGVGVDSKDVGGLNKY